MWDCKYKMEKDHCRRRKTICYPGGKYCVLKGKYDFPLRVEPDELDKGKNSRNVSTARKVSKKVKKRKTGESRKRAAGLKGK